MFFFAEKKIRFFVSDCKSLRFAFFVSKFFAYFASSDKVKNIIFVTHPTFSLFCFPMQVSNKKR